MKKLDFNDYSLCRMQGKIFELSITKINTSSAVFIRRFMNSNIALAFDDKSILISDVDSNNVFEILEEEYGISSYGKQKYTNNELYWIGYIYRVICLYYDLSSKTAIKYFPPKDIINYYPIYHTFDPEYAAERMMEEKEYVYDYMERGLKLLKKYNLLHELIGMLNKEINVYIDRPIGYNHNGIIYNQNYGYIKEYKALDDEYQDAYVIGIDEPLKTFNGKIIAIINRKDDIEDKLVVCDKTKNYTNKEIEDFIIFQEKYHKYKIIR